jgi:cation diffusion facilitator CzcD-associated flavoprotein CzcO
MAMQSKTPSVQESFHGVLVCSGHYSVPHYPTIEDLHLFGGRILHSHDYRHGEEFR